MSLNYDWNDIRLPQGDFITRLTSLSTQVAFSSTLYWISLLQYDNLSEEVGINTRLQWIPRAGQEGFIVFNYNLQDKDKDKESVGQEGQARAAEVLRRAGMSVHGEGHRRGKPLRDAPPGSILETSPASVAIVRALAKRTFASSYG